MGNQSTPGDKAESIADRAKRVALSKVKAYDTKWGKAKPVNKRDSPMAPQGCCDFMSVQSSLTTDKINEFLLVYADTGIKAQALRAVNVSPESINTLAKKSPPFKAALERAKQFALGSLEMEAVRRAKDGTPEPVFYKGKPVGKILKYSDRLLEFLLASRDDKFKVRTPAGGGDGGGLQVIINQFSDGKVAETKETVDVSDAEYKEEQTIDGDGDNPAIQVATPKLSDAGMDIPREPRDEQAGGSGLAS